MMDITHPNIVDYLLNIAPDRDNVLSDMERFALERNFPIVGPLVGKMLFVFAKTLNAKRVLELGSGFGYSAFWFAKAVGKDGTVICTEGSPDNVTRGMEYLKRGKVLDRIQYHTGNALDIIDTLDGTFDIIFNDIDKRYYPKAYRKALPKLRKGGLLISDNVLWSGKIFDKKPDADTAGILTYNRLINSTKELSTTIIPLRDGVSVSVKL